MTSTLLMSRYSSFFNIVLIDNVSICSSKDLDQIHIKNTFVKSALFVSVWRRLIELELS